ncbi:hypothetical protein VVD49_05320 [Uliginosibacterium sp. H3]|uniref:DUF4410 domain-containing protein n=1 Tax=Uliginosibacterium silvisoli TaxID=3114758 RepID=A0ABU6K037_9RHOO|nr:hypothetical protein [Uliginosibacterium sp. H3]
MFKSISACLSAVVLLSGCVVGQQINMEYKPAPKAIAENGSKVKALVTDERAEVKSGKKEQWFIGTYRGSFGNTFDVSNYEKRPLVEQISQDLKEELKSLGFTEATGVQGQKTLGVQIREWSFDGYANGEFWYSLHVSVIDQAGKSLYDKNLTDRKTVTGTVMGAAKGGFERDMPGLYNSMIHTIVRNNKELLDALK